MKWEILQSLCMFNNRAARICRETGNNCNKNNCPFAREEKELKLFVWDHTYGLVFAIAENVNEGKKLVEKEKGFEVTEWGRVNTYPIEKIAKSVYRRCDEKS